MIKRPPRIFKDGEGLYILGEGRKRVRRPRKGPVMQTYSGHDEKVDVDKARMKDILAHEELKK